jgi:hypothetical protein
MGTNIQPNNFLHNFEFFAAAIPSIKPTASPTAKLVPSIILSSVRTFRFNRILS